MSDGPGNTNNSGGDVKRGHKRWERESDRKTATGNGGRREQAKQGMYAGGSKRTGVSVRPEATKCSTDED